MAQQIPARPDLEHYRRQAKALVRAHRAGETEAAVRAQAALGPRARERFLLSDAQLVLAREHGHRSWPEFRRAVLAARSGPPSLPDALAAARAEWGERGEVVLETGEEYAPGAPVRVRVRRRGNRYDIDDLGAAVAAAGRPRGWLAVAEAVVEEAALNVNRRGVVFVPAFEGRDIARLALRVGDTSADVHAALLELDDDPA